MRKGCVREKKRVREKGERERRRGRYVGETKRVRKMDEKKRKRSCGRGKEGEDDELGKRKE